MTNVTGVTGVARALPLTAPDADPPAPVAAAPSATAPSALIRAVPFVRPSSDEGRDSPGRTVTAPAPGGAGGNPGATRPARRPRRKSGAREQKRQETRGRIVDAAADLFAERGFEAVSVMEIARRAGVVEKTVFNHFPVKEGLVFDADPPMRAALLDAVRRRPAGESVSAAAGSFVVSSVGMLGSPEAADGVARMAKVIRGSRTLQVREREIVGELTESLAGLIAVETGAAPGQLEPWLTANAVLGLYAGLLELARDRVLAGVSGPELGAELRRQGQRGLSLLQFGLAGYAKSR